MADWNDLQDIYNRLGNMRAVADYYGCSLHKVHNECKRRGIVIKSRGAQAGQVWTTERRENHRKAMNLPERKAQSRERLLRRLPKMGGSANSPIEKLLQDALIRAGVSFRTQRRMLDKYIVDIELIDRPVIIEADGALHRLPYARERDRQRDVELQGAGYRVYRFSGQQIHASPDDCIRQVAEAEGLTAQSSPIVEIRHFCTGESNPAWKGGQIERTCDYCGRTIKRHPSHNKFVKAFCDSICYGRWLDEHPEQSNVLKRWRRT